jgi:Ca2+-binding EF-hand superfamily protein
MPLADKLATASQKYKSDLTTCKFAALTSNKELSKKDREALAQVVNLTDRDDHRYIPHQTLADLLRGEGYDVSASAISRHRGGNCSCRRLGKIS